MGSFLVLALILLLIFTERGLFAVGVAALIIYTVMLLLLRLTFSLAGLFLLVCIGIIVLT